MSENQRGERAPGLPRAERPTGFIYLARRRSDGTHWQVLLLDYVRLQAVICDYKRPENEPIVEPFDNLDIVDKQPREGSEPEIILASR